MALASKPLTRALPGQPTIKQQNKSAWPQARMHACITTPSTCGRERARVPHVTQHNTHPRLIAIKTKSKATRQRQSWFRPNPRGVVPKLSQLWTPVVYHHLHRLESGRGSAGRGCPDPSDPVQTPRTQAAPPVRFLGVPKGPDRRPRGNSGSRAIGQGRVCFSFRRGTTTGWHCTCTALLLASARRVGWAYRPSCPDVSRRYRIVATVERAVRTVEAETRGWAMRVCANYSSHHDGT